MTSTYKTNWSVPNSLAVITTVLGFPIIYRDLPLSYSYEPGPVSGRPTVW